MSFIHNELLPRLEANEITREEMQTYLDDLKNLKDKYFGKIKVKIEVLGFFSYSGSHGEGFNFFSKVSLLSHPDNYFYIIGQKSFDEVGWEQWSVDSKYASNYKHTQHDLDTIIHPINWYYFSFINQKFENNKSLGGENFEIDVPEAMVDYYHQLPTQELKLEPLEDISEDIIITSHMTAKEYNDIIDFYRI